MSRIARLSLLVTLFVACGGLRSPQELRPMEGPETGSPSDSGQPSTKEDGGGISPNLPTTDGGMDGGSQNPSTSPGDFTWAKMAVTPNNQGFEAISGRGTGATLELFVASSTRLLRYSAGEWKTVIDGQAASASLSSVWASNDGAVFAVGAGLFSCLNNCAQQSAFKVELSTLGAKHVCGSGKNVYAVGSTVNGTSYLLRFDFLLEKWQTVVPNLDAYAVERCWVQPTGEVFIPAQSVILRYDGVTVGAEPVDYPATWSASDVANQYWAEVTAMGGSLVAAGSGRRVLGRGANGRWSLVFDPAGADTFNTILALGPNEALAAGQASPSDERMARLGAGRDPAWRFIADAPALNTSGSWAAGPNEIYVAGAVAGGVAGAVYRGTR